MAIAIAPYGLDLTPIDKLTKDLKSATITLSPKEARYLVDVYYQIQEYRKRAANQVKAMAEEPHAVLAWTFNNFEVLENQVKRALDAYTDGQFIGAWAKKICGIGPVISAGLLAHIDIAKAPTAGHIWSFAGLDPRVEWLGKEKAKKIVNEVVGSGEKVTDDHLAQLAAILHRKVNNIRNVCIKDGEKLTKTKLIAGLAKPPNNQSLKTLCWKIGESFVKVRNNDKDVYGHIYYERKLYETEKNLAGEYADQADKKLRTTNLGKDTDAHKWYAGCFTQEDATTILDESDAQKRMKLVKELAKEPESGVKMLPPAHIDQRAKRKAVKLFLAHWHDVAYRHHHGEAPPKPYPIAILGHTHEIKPFV